MLREHQFLHGLARARRARFTFRARFSQSGSLINPPEPLQRNAVWGTTTTTTTTTTNTTTTSTIKLVKQLPLFIIPQTAFRCRGSGGIMSEPDWENRSRE